MMEFISCEDKNHVPYVPIDLFRAEYDKSWILNLISDSLPIKGLAILWGELRML